MMNHMKSFLTKIEGTKWRIYAGFALLLVCLGINIFILIEGHMDAETSAQQSNTVAEVVATTVNAVAPETIDPTNETYQLVIRKVVGHAMLFMFAGSTGYLGFYWIFKARRHIFIPFVLITIFQSFIAFLSEFIQSFASARSGNLHDVLIDMAGAMTGIILTLIVVAIVSAIVHNPRRKQLEEATV